MFQFIYPHSPVDQDFVWLAEYHNEDHLCEYDLDTKVENPFQEIEKNELVRFGLIGHGNKLFYEVMGGVFKLNGAMYEVYYKEGDREFYLTGQNQKYNDIIQYKDAEIFFNPYNPNSEQLQRITNFNFGYKTELAVFDANLNFKAIYSVPLDGSPFINFWLVSSREMSGKFVIKKNGIVVDEIPAPMEPNKGYELNWLVR